MTPARLFACALILSAAPVFAELPQNTPPVVRFFADGLEAPLSTFQTMISAAEACRAKFPAECKQAETFAGAAKLRNHIESMGPLFAEALAFKPSIDTASFAALSDQLRDSVLRFRQEVRDYDLQLLPRLGAVLVACRPQALKERERLGALTYTNFRLFEEQSKNEFEHTSDALTRDSVVITQRIREEWPETACAQALELSGTFMDALDDKTAGSAKAGRQPARAAEARKLSREISYVLELAEQLSKAHDPSAEPLPRN